MEYELYEGVFNQVEDFIHSQAANGYVVKEIKMIKPPSYDIKLGKDTGALYLAIMERNILAHQFFSKVGD